MLYNPVLLEVNLFMTIHTEYIGGEGSLGNSFFLVNPVIPFKVHCLALVEDRGRDLAAMIFQGKTALVLAHHCRRWPISPLRLVLNLPLMMNSCKAHLTPFENI